MIFSTKQLNLLILCIFQDSAKPISHKWVSANGRTPEEGKGRRGEDLFGFVILTLCEIFCRKYHFSIFVDVSFTYNSDSMSIIVSFIIA